MTDNTQTPERAALLPCPFCGGEPSAYEGKFTSSVKCDNGHAIHEYKPTLAEAITAWNTRTTGGEALREAHLANVRASMTPGLTTTVASTTGEALVEALGENLAKLSTHLIPLLSANSEAHTDYERVVAAFTALASLQGREADDGVAEHTTFLQNFLEFHHARSLRATEWDEIKTFLARGHRVNFAALRTQRQDELREALAGLEWAEGGYSLQTPFDGDVDDEGRAVVVGGETVVTFADSDKGDKLRIAFIDALKGASR